MIKAGCLESRDGTRIDDEEVRQALMKDMRQFAEGGFFCLVSEWVVRLPLAARL